MNLIRAGAALPDIFLVFVLRWSARRQAAIVLYLAVFAKTDVFVGQKFTRDRFSNKTRPVEKKNLY